jgi:hypothetical protein
VSGYANGSLHPEPADGPRPNRKWTAAMAVLVVLFVAMASYDLITGGVAAAGRPSASRTAAVSRASGTASAQSATVAPSTGPSGAATPASSQPGSALEVATAAAYGPDGVSDGDHPGQASGVINGGTGQPWYSHWYTSATFGNLQSGTGLLLDMGETVTVSSLRLVLGSTAGADVQIRIGNLSGSGELPVAASASDVSGTVQLPVTDPASGQYVLIWFTRLPLDSPGKYQVSVYSAAVYGTKGTLFAAPGPMSSTKGDAFRSYSITIQS